jgi:hypothetical protein
MCVLRTAHLVTRFGAGLQQLSAYAVMRCLQVLAQYTPCC